MLTPQQIKFHTVEDFLDFLPENELQIVSVLRNIILENLPNCKEKLSYNVPYYYGRRRICFIWPASVPWGKVKLNGVQLGFCNAKLMQDELNYLDKDNRKQIGTKTFFSVKEIEEDLIKMYLFEALEIDKSFGK